MARTFGLVDYKVQEAEYFLEQLKGFRMISAFYEVQFCASAFAAAARSITFAMQASLKGNLNFEDWYKRKQQILRNDPLAQFFNKFRTVTQHIGESIVNSGTRSGGVSYYYFTPCADLPDVPEQDVVTACQEYFVTILELVYDCYTDLRPLVDSYQYFTKEHFASKGKTIEDAEEELGFPRGWTDIGNPSLEPYRWQAMRDAAGSSPIEHQFELWLNKSLPKPQPLPKFDRSLWD